MASLRSIRPSLAKSTAITKVAPGLRLPVRVCRTVLELAVFHRKFHVLHVAIVIL